MCVCVLEERDWLWIYWVNDIEVRLLREVSWQIKLNAYYVLSTAISFYLGTEGVYTHTWLHLLINAKSCIGVVPRTLPCDGHRQVIRVGQSVPSINGGGARHFQVVVALVVRGKRDQTIVAVGHAKRGPLRPKDDALPNLLRCIARGRVGNVNAVVRAEKRKRVFMLAW